jgi:hypothetical protein
MVAPFPESDMEANFQRYASLLAFTRTSKLTQV